MMELAIGIFFVMMFLLVLAIAWFIQKIMNDSFGGIKESLRYITDEIVKKNQLITLNIKRVPELNSGKRLSIRSNQ